MNARVPSSGYTCLMLNIILRRCGVCVISAPCTNVPTYLTFEMC